MATKSEKEIAKGLAIGGIKGRIDRIWEWFPNAERRLRKEVEDTISIAWEQGYIYGHRCGIDDCDTARLLPNKR